MTRMTRIFFYSAAINPCYPRNPRLNHYQHLAHYCTDMHYIEVN